MSVVSKLKNVKSRSGINYGEPIDRIKLDLHHMLNETVFPFLGTRIGG